MVDCEQKMNHLPDWLLDMRRKVEESKAAHKIAETRIENLRDGIDKLQDTIVRNGYSKGECNSKKVDSDKIMKRFIIIYLPPDMICCILSFLDVSSIVRTEMTSISMLDAITSSNFWSRTFLDQYSHFFNKTILLDREFIVCREKSYNFVLKFMASMKSLRSINRQDSIKPILYFKSEKKISHPIPLYNDNGDTSSTIISFAETMNHNYRMYSVHALTILKILTCYERDELIINQLIGSSVVSILVSLLQNESGTIQQFACDVIGNLVVYHIKQKESAHMRQQVAMQEEMLLHYKYHRKRPSHGVCGPMDEARSGPVMAHLVSVNHKIAGGGAVSSQLQMCDGRRQLLNLLTSPSACVSIASARNVMSSIHLSNQCVHLPSAHGETSTTAVSDQNRISAGAKSVMQIKTTSNVQGIACKSASRALINLFLSSNSFGVDESEVPGRVRFDCIPDVDRRDSLEIDMSNLTSPQAVNYYQNFSNSDQAPIQHHLFLSRLETAFYQQRQTISLQDAVIENIDYSDDVKAMSCPSVTYKFFHSLKWRFQYFHKSGALKESTEVYLEFSDTGKSLRGRGFDEVGVFYLHGKVERDIAGYSWYFSKSYLNIEDLPYVPPASSQGRDLPLYGPQDSAYDTKVKPYVEDVQSFFVEADESSSNNVYIDLERRNKKSANMIHIGYTSSGVEDSKSKGAEKLVHIPADISGDQTWQDDIWGFGLWGVWEPCSTLGAHFDLVKGGVFHAYPVL